MKLLILNHRFKILENKRIFIKKKIENLFYKMKIILKKYNKWKLNIWNA